MKRVDDPVSLANVTLLNVGKTNKSTHRQTIANILDS